MQQELFNWKIGGAAGYGVMTVGPLLAKLATRCGRSIATYSEYPSLIQGGHNTYEVTISVSDRPALATVKAVDCLVCLNAETFTLHCDRLGQSSLVVVDAQTVPLELPTADTQPVIIDVPFATIQAELKADKIMINMIAFGASAALLQAPWAQAKQLISDQFTDRKSADVAQLNIVCARRGFEYVQEHFSPQSQPILSEKVDSAEGSPDQLSSETVDSTLLMTGNEAFALGAVLADCRFFAAYPMTPTSAVQTVLAAWQEKTGMVVRHNEDEIAVVSSALGASWAGVRSAVATSGGGFALMTESLSYAGVAEIPLVVLLGQRPGPATGMPTWTEQGDLLFAVHAGHGEFPKIVLAPGTAEEMVELTIKAFDLADVYQLPVIVLSDKVLAESHAQLRAEVIERLAKQTSRYGKLLKEWTSDQPYLRYQLSDDGVSPRLVPGAPGAYWQANSYEHLEDSHTTESATARRAQVAKRAQKLVTYLEADFQMPTIEGDLQTAQLVLISWGSLKQTVLAAQADLLKQGITTASIHFTHLSPLPSDKVQQLFNSFSTPTLTIENNSTAQFAKLLRQETGIELNNHLLKSDGRPIFRQEIVAAVQQQVNQHSR